LNPEKILQRAILISVVLSAITLILYAVLGAQIRMVADDFCSAYCGLTYGPIEGVVLRYQTWAG